MPRTQRSFPISGIQNFKDAIFNWTRRYEQVVWLDSNEHSNVHTTFEAVVAVSKQTSKSDFCIQSIDEAQNFTDINKDWLFGYIGYDFKNELENLRSTNFDGLGFPVLHFFCPDKIIVIKNQKAEFLYREFCANEIDADFLNLTDSTSHKPELTTMNIRIQMRIHKDAYFEKVGKLLEHIHRGDVYEANFCQEFYATNSWIDPWSVYQNLNTISRPPFASFLRLDDKYLLCASPERYLKRQGDTVISQPIKGTAKRDCDPIQDAQLKKALSENAKERSENIMIADLVRNDLSKSALKGSVQVDELCRVYSFQQVHQMISTLSCQVASEMPSTQIIKETFPMGSMTGAPKISAMHLIEDLEETKRGLYSGAVGYFAPNGDFDFNVVIRSILYNASRKYVSYSVGSAITAKSNPEKEYEECLIKAKAMRSVLEGEHS